MEENKDGMRKIGLLKVDNKIVKLWVFFGKYDEEVVASNC
jgi:hypothetical protein